MNLYFPETQFLERELFWCMAILRYFHLGDLSGIQGICIINFACIYLLSPLLQRKSSNKYYSSVKGSTKENKYLQ